MCLFTKFIKGSESFMIDVFIRIDISKPVGKIFGETYVYKYI